MYNNKIVLQEVNMFDPEISGFLSRYAIVPTNIIFEMVREFQKPENTDKRYMELLYENHCEYEQRIIDKIASLKSLTKIDLNFYTKPINLQLAKNLSFENAVKHSCILLNQDSQGKLIIATDDPFHPERFEFIKEKTGVEYSIVLVIHTQMIKTIELIYGRSVSKQKPIIGTPLPSASNVAKRTKSNVIPSSIQASIVEGEYHGKGVSERTNIYQTDTMPDIRSMSTGESNLPAIYDSETIQLHHHNFDVQKSELWALVKQEPRQLSREPFKEKGGLFNWFDAKSF